MLMLFWSLAGLILVVAGVVLVYTTTLPSEFRIARTVRIDTTRDKIFPLIENLRTFDQWNPFAKQDPTIAITYSGPEAGKGAANRWTSRGRAGKGDVEITDTEPSSSVTMALHMETPMQARNTILFTLQPASSTTTDVTWSMTGQCAFVPKLFGVVFNTDKRIGSAFDKGLADLKAMAEQS